MSIKMKQLTFKFFLAVGALFVLGQGCKKDKADLSVKGITLSKSTTTLKPGATETLSFTIFPENADNQNVSWTSSDQAIATVSSGERDYYSNYPGR